VPQLQIRVERIGFALNRVPGGDIANLPPEIPATIEQQGLELVAVLPSDPAVGALDAVGRPIIDLPPQSPLRQAVEALVSSVILS